MSRISIVVPFLNEFENLKAAPARIEHVRSLLPGHEVQFIFVDDGSTDGSGEWLSTHLPSGCRLIRFSRNFGSHNALFAAIDRCDSDYLTFMSADMQESPDLPGRMLHALKSSGAHLALAIRNQRAAPPLDRAASRIYNAFTRKFVFSGSPQLGADVFMVSRKVIDVLKSIPEKNTSIYGILYLLGFKRVEVQYDQLPRKHGKSRWTLAKKAKLFSDTVVSFTILPLRLITALGIFFSLAGFGYGALVVLLYLQGKITLLGFSTVIAILTFGFGLVFLMIGVISEYLWRMFDQIRPRPRYLIMEDLEAISE